MSALNAQSTDAVNDARQGPPVKSMQNTVCILHIGPRTDESIKPFDTHTWEKTKSISETRLKQCDSGSKSKYTALCKQLPLTYGEFDGYHCSCYKNFTALRKTTYTGSLGPNSNRKGILRSQISSSSEQPSTSGVFPSKCIFCDCVKKKQR